MHWLDEYKNDVIELRKSVNEAFLKDIKERSKELIGEYKEIFKPLEDGRLDAGDIEKITDKYLEKNLEKVIDEMKRAAAIQRRLAGLYARLAEAAEEDWREYATMCVKADFDSQIPLLELLAETHIFDD